MQNIENASNSNHIRQKNHVAVWKNTGVLTEIIIIKISSLKNILKNPECPIFTQFPVSKFSLVTVTPVSSS